LKDNKLVKTNAAMAYAKGLGLKLPVANLAKINFEIEICFF
jgi:hypothetical protein